MLLLIILIIGLRYTVPERRIDIEEFTAIDPATGYHSEALDKGSSLTTEPISSYHNIKTKLKQHEPAKKSIPQKYRIDINTGDSAALIRLPGIGPVLSARIIKYRRLLGGYARIEQLKEVYGLPEETFDAIKGQVFADSLVVKRFNINSAGYKELARFPYFEKYEVTAILKYRELKGKINGINDLTENKLITTEKAKRVSPYLSFGE